MLLSCHVFLTLLSLMKMSPRDIPMVVVFGRPGAGKTAVADRAVELLLLHPQQQSLRSSSILRPIGLDLDVCVPQWMRDNFAKGFYPTLQERIVFAESACNYVEERLLQEQNKLTSKNDDRIGAVVSFSFVNTDLRDVFRQKFPQARWFLVDTSEEEANDRILKREGHFYKGKVETATTKEEQARPRSDNEDWNFAPVTFPHILLDGLLPIDHNADTVAKGLLEATYPKD